MAFGLRIDVNGVALDLLQGRGVYSPADEALFVADLHLGKDATFRQNGLAVPAGSSIATLHRLGAMLEQSGARHVIVLGDLFHARSSMTQDVVAAFRDFISRYVGTAFTLVRGNHDRHLGQRLADLEMNILEPGVRFGEFVLEHEPVERSLSGVLQMCGHVHPAVHVGSGAESIGRLPCFWLRDERLVVPALGNFTGCHTIRPAKKDRVWIVIDGADGEVVEYRPAAGPVSRRNRLA